MLTTFLFSATVAGCGIDWTVPDEPDGSGSEGGGASSSTGGAGGQTAQGGGSTCPDGNAECCLDDPTCETDCADANAGACPVPCDQDPNQPECMSECEALGECEQCAQCSFGGACAEVYENCLQQQECTMFIDCITNCGADAPCFDQCSGQYPNGLEGAQMVAVCVSQVCPQSCEGQIFGL